MASASCVKEGGHGLVMFGFWFGNPPGVSTSLACVEAIAYTSTEVHISCVQCTDGGGCITYRGLTRV